MWVEGLVILAMLLANAVFAAFEMALASVSQARLEALAQLGRRGAAAALDMKTHLERSLAVVQVGITVAGAVAAATGGAGVDEALAPVLRSHVGLPVAWAEFVAVIVLVVPLSALTIVFAELVPKMFALDNKEYVALSLAPAMKAVSMVFYPGVFVLEKAVTRIMRFGRTKGRPPREPVDPEAGLMELRAAAATARANRLIGALEEQIVGAASRLSVRTVREAMLPAADIATIPEEASLADALIRAHLHMHTRYPVCAKDGDPQTITGYVNFKDIVAALKIHPADPRLANVKRPLPRMNGGTTLAQALTRMTRGNVHIAVVTGDDGRVLGMITLEDIVAELVGPIGDEYDSLPAHLQPLASGWIAGGGAALDAVRGATALPFSVAGAAAPTLADWCDANHPGGLRAGDVVRGPGCEVEVRKTRRARLMEGVIRQTGPS